MAHQGKPSKKRPAKSLQCALGEWCLTLIVLSKEPLNILSPVDEMHRHVTAFVCSLTSWIKRGPFFPVSHTWINRKWLTKRRNGSLVIFTSEQPTRWKRELTKQTVALRITYFYCSVWMTAYEPPSYVSHGENFAIHGYVYLRAFRIAP